MKSTGLSLLLAAALFAACGGTVDDEAGAGDEASVDESEVISAKATSSGKIDGEAVELKEGAADSLIRWKSDGKVTISGSRIELSSGANTCTEWKKNAQGLKIEFQNNQGEVTPGSVYEIGDSETLDAFSSAVYAKSNDHCENAAKGLRATSGYVKILRATQRAIVGEYKLRFGKHGVLEGTFDAPTCLKKRDYGNGPAPACME